MVCKLFKAVNGLEGVPYRDEGRHVSTPTTPSWWELEVVDAAGDLVYLWRTAAGSAAASLAWSGRDQDGLVVENGTYTVTLTALDDHWNAGLPCSQAVSVSNRVQPPE